MRPQRFLFLFISKIFILIIIILIDQKNILLLYLNLLLLNDSKFILLHVLGKPNINPSFCFKSYNCLHQVYRTSLRCKKLLFLHYVHNECHELLHVILNRNKQQNQLEKATLHFEIETPVSKDIKR